MSRFRLSWSIRSSDEGLLLREFLKKEQISKSALTDIKFQGGRILLNGEERTVRTVLKEGDYLEVEFPEEIPSEGLLPEHIPLSICYEDPYVLVVNKQAGMSTIPSREHPNGSLANALLGYYQSQGIQATTHIVTRLDRDTSGLVLIAKHRHIHHILSQDQRNRAIHRVYEALVHGKMVESSGTVTKPIGRDPDSIIVRMVREDGQYACTHYHVKKVFEDVSYVELTLETGRTHQIRVHMASLGHPLVGDDLYGGHRDFLSRQALHCRQLTFIHPIDRRKLTFQAELPEDFLHFLHTQPS